MTTFIAPLRCPSGHDVASGWAFCGVCGAKPLGLCPDGHPVEAGHRFCGVCGSPAQLSVTSVPTPVMGAPAWQPAMAPPHAPIAVAVPAPPSARCGRCSAVLDDRPFCGSCGASRGMAVDPMTVLRRGLAQVPLEVVLPLRAWWTSAAWRQGWLGLFAGAAVLPFVFLHAMQDQDLSQAVWAFAIYFAAMWLVAIRSLTRPEPVDWRVLLGIPLFTAIVGVAIAIFLEENLLTGDSSNVLVMVFGVGFPEDFAKALPVAVLLFLPMRFSAPRTYLYLGALSG